MFINVKTNPNNARKPKELRVNKRNLFTPKKFILFFLMIKERNNTAGKLLKKITYINAYFGNIRTLFPVTSGQRFGIIRTA